MSERKEGKGGKSKLWMRKVQPTKRGPSQQLVVNILGKWLEMCSFFLTKINIQSCPNLTHRLTLLHDFSAVVGQTPPKLCFLDTVINSLRLKFTNEPSIFVDGDLDESIKRSASDRLGDLVPQVRARTSPRVFRDMALLGLCLELSFSVLYCRTQANLPTLMHFAEPAIWPSSIRTEDPTCANHVDVLTV